MYMVYLRAIFIGMHGLSQGHICRYAWFISGPYLLQM